jgi:hypothetical protein
MSQVPILSIFWVRTVYLSLISIQIIRENINNTYAFLNFKMGN